MRNPNKRTFNIRFSEVGGLQGVKRSLTYIENEIDVENSLQNQWPRVKESMDKLKTLIPERPRKYDKNTVFAVQYDLTASPEWWQGADKEKRQEFFNRALQWLEDRHRTINIFAVARCVKENTPHLIAFVCPITNEGKLNYRYFFGSREKCQNARESFSDALADLGPKYQNEWEYVGTETWVWKNGTYIKIKTTQASTEPQTDKE